MSGSISMAGYLLTWACLVIDVSSACDFYLDTHVIRYGQKNRVIVIVVQVISHRVLVFVHPPLLGRRTPRILVDVHP